MKKLQVANITEFCSNDCLRFTSRYINHIPIKDFFTCAFVN